MNASTLLLRLAPLMALGLLALATAGDSALERPGPPARAALEPEPLRSPALLPSGVSQPEIDPAARRSGASDSWWKAVSTCIRARQYHASRAESGLQAPNRAHDLRTCFGAGGVEIVPRSNDRADGWRFAWETVRWGRPGRLVELAPVEPEASGGRVTYERPGLREWYVNSEAGLEQGFTVDRRPPGAGPLRIEGRLSGGLRAELRPEENAVEVRDAGGASVLRYGKLEVRDAIDRSIAAWLELEGTSLAMVINDEEATYPLIVDPLMTSPAWTAEGSTAGAYFGTSVAAAGDVNGDGFSDVIVGALFDQLPELTGGAFVFHGSSSGLETSPAWIAEGDQGGAGFGGSVAAAGDVNGDGFSDVIVGASAYDNGEEAEGRAFVYHGSSSGLENFPAWTVEGNQAWAQLGGSVATAGDVNGDGFSDVIIGARWYDNGEQDEGRAFVYHGSPSGLATSPAWIAEGDRPRAFFGSVAGAGDVNGDDCSDIVVGAGGDLDPGRAFVYHGSPSGLASLPAWTVEHGSSGDSFGSSVATAGDVNGDGYSDVIIGAHGFDNGDQYEGRAFIYHGSVAGLGSSYAWSATVSQSPAYFGHSVATAGDVNGDGYSDVIVGAFLYHNGEEDEGAAFVYLGSAGGVSDSPAWTAEGGQPGVHFGHSVATAGDVNGDGFSDVIVGAPQGGEGSEGQAFVYHGFAAGIEIFPSWTAESNQVQAYYGCCVASAGDVNGDGFSDVMVGAWEYDNGQEGEGLAFVYHGSTFQSPGHASWSLVRRSRLI